MGKKMIQIRNVPEALHRKLKARAAEAGMSLSDYLLREMRKTAERPTMEELMRIWNKVMKDKISWLTALLEERFGRKMVSHRAGRWAMDGRYVAMLQEQNVNGLKAKIATITALLTASQTKLKNDRTILNISEVGSVHACA